MQPKWIVGILFLLFIFVRLRWPRGTDERENTRKTREWITSSLFTFCFLFSYVSYFASESLQRFSVPLPNVVLILGGVMSVIGLGVLEWVHRALGVHFSPHLELRSDHKIVASGPYHYVRHPMYSCGLLFLIGTGLLSSNILVLCVPTSSFVVLLILRIKDEEKMMASRFGQEWMEYSKKTGFLLPRLW